MSPGVSLRYEATYTSHDFWADEREGDESAGGDIEAKAWAGRQISSAPTPRVAYFMPRAVGEYHFGERHPMKPHRLTLTNELVMGYGLHERMDMFSPRMATAHELEAFHDEDYIDFLSRVTPDNVGKFTDALSRFNIGDDCPIFDSMFDYCRQYAGASMAAARKLNSGNADIAVNWTGGLHHAKKFEASGFCYINDIVLAILELLRIHPRVLYIDIDIHHGDGVQEAFYTSNRVLTVSFHKYAENFFPGTGDIDEFGDKLGKYFSLNVPLQDGIDDQSYVTLFKAIMEPTIATFRPSVIVLQCGADSLGCDRLGCFNLSIQAHGECVRFIKAFNIPLMILGGGGYTIKNVSRCWTYETAVLLDAQYDIPSTLPSTPFDDYFRPDNRLLTSITGKGENLNTRRSLERIRIGILERLRFLHGAPSVAMQEIPPNLASWLAEEDERRGIDREGGAKSPVDEMGVDIYHDHAPGTMGPPPTPLGPPSKSAAGGRRSASVSGALGASIGTTSARQRTQSAGAALKRKVSAKTKAPRATAPRTPKAAVPPSPGDGDMDVDV